MKVAVITGSSRGIGKATAIELAKNGFSIVVNYYKNEFEAKNVVDQILNLGQNAISIKADVSNFQESKMLIDKSIDEFGKIDVLVNNAGISLTKMFQDVSEDEWKRLIAVNLGSVFNCCSDVANHMISRKKGKIINVSSILGISGASMESHYSASKAAIIGFTKSLAKELGPSGISVNCVAPGVIDTQMNDNLSKQELDILKEQTPLQRIGTPQDVANAIEFLSSEKSDFITGQVLNIDGGLSNL